MGSNGAGPCGHILFDEFAQEEQQAAVVEQEEQQAAVMAKAESALTLLRKEAETTRRQAGTRGNEEAVFARVQ